MPEQLPPGIPPSLIEAWRAGIAQVPGFYAQLPSLLTEAEPGEAAALIAAVSRRYLPGATYTVLVVTGTGNLVPALVTGAAVLVIGAAVLGLVQARRKRRRSPDAGSWPGAPPAGDD